MRMAGRQETHECMSVLLRFTQSGWLTGTRVAVERLGKLPPKQLKELRKEAAKKGVWLEHRTKGKLADATRTYWLVGVDELDTLLPARQEEERTPEDALTLSCQHADIGCLFKVVGGSQNSLNAHLRHCKFRPTTKAAEAAAKGKKTKSARAVAASKADKREKKEERQKGGEKGKEKKKKPSQKAAPKVDSQTLLLESSSSNDEEADRQPTARATRGKQLKKKRQRARAAR